MMVYCVRSNFLLIRFSSLFLPFVLLYLLTYTFIYFYRLRAFHIQSVIIHYFVLFIFVLKLSQIQQRCAASGWLLCLFDMPSLIFGGFLTFWHKKMSQTHLVPVLLLGRTISSGSPESVCLILSIIFRNQDVSTNQHCLFQTFKKRAFIPLAEMMVIEKFYL